MTGKKHNDSEATTPPDEIQREFWQYRRVWVTVIILLIAARIIFPHIPLLKGWEQKFAASALELGKTDLPIDALRVNNIDSVNDVFKPKFQIPAEVANFEGGPLMVAAWKCSPMGAEGACLRYLWNGEPLTLVVSKFPTNKKVGKNSGPFTRTGWGGYYTIQGDFAAAVVGPFDPRDILSSWPYAVKFANKPSDK